MIAWSMTALHNTDMDVAPTIKDNGRFIKLSKCKEVKNAKE